LWCDGVAEAPNILLILLALLLSLAMHFFCFAEVPYHRSKGRPPSKRKESRLRRRYRARHQYHPPRIRKKKKWKKPTSPSASITSGPPLSCHHVWLFKIFKTFAFIKILVRRALVVLTPRVLASYIAYRASALHDAAEARFDSDSFKIGIDNHASRTMSPNKDHFEDLTLYNTTTTVGGIGSGLSIKGVGTFVFKIEDDDGGVHRIKIPNSLYVPGLKTVLLSPQHWAQEARDHHPKPEGTCSSNTSKACVLYWNQLQYKRTVYFHRSTNTPVFRTAPGALSHRAFVSTFEAMEAPLQRQKEQLRFRPTLNATFLREQPEAATFLREQPDEAEFVAEETLLEKATQQPDPTADDDTVQISNTAPKEHQQQTIGSLSFDPAPRGELHDDQHYSAEDPQAELIRWHYRLGHLPFPRLKILAETGQIPKRLAKVIPPRCAGCLFGAMTKVPWRTKGKQDTTIFSATKAGQVVSVDQMISTQVGFVAQLEGRLTTQRYRAATVFVDHFSRLKFIYLMTSLSSEETVAAKKAFERFASNNGVHIQQYHCDNGRFADKAFINHCEQQQQHITYCGVNAHFQNGIAEKAIRDIQEQARKQLLHARSRWPEVIHLALWPYALRMAVHLHNTVPSLADGRSPLEVFASLAVGSKMRDNHTFGCPVFALQNALAAGNTIPKWSPRARLGFNLGPSPSHARNVALVLNLSTGLVSPQYHCRFGDFFETTRYAKRDLSAGSTWQHLAGLIRVDRLSSLELHDNNAVSLAEATNIAETVLPPSENDATEEEELFEADSQQHNDFHDVTAVPGDPNNPAETHTTDNDSDTTTQTPTAGISSRGRRRNLSRRMAESVSQREFFGDRNMHYMASQSTVGLNEAEDDRLHEEHLALQSLMGNPIAFHAEMMGDIMYFHQSMKQPDSEEFVKAVVKEVNGHIQNDHWQLVPRSEVPPDPEVVPSVWAMRRKRNLTTNEITKYKARLNMHGGKQTYGVNYYETFARVVSWFGIRLVVVFAIVFHWSLRQVDFVMAYTGLEFVYSSCLLSYSSGLSVKLTLSWHTLKLPLRWICTWNSLLASLPNTATPKAMF
jgi:hypothetical protein